MCASSLVVERSCDHDHDDHDDDDHDDHDHAWRDEAVYVPES